MTEKFEEETQYNGARAWIGYWQMFGQNAYLCWKHHERRQRRAKCRTCGIIIPKEIPRIQFTGPWHGSGHYCLPCALQEVQEAILSRERIIELANRNLEDLKRLRDLIIRAKNREAYLEAMAIHMLNTRLQGRKGR